MVKVLWGYNNAAINKLAGRVYGFAYQFNFLVERPV